MPNWLDSGWGFGPGDLGGRKLLAFQLAAKLQTEGEKVEKLFRHVDSSLVEFGFVECRDIWLTAKVEEGTL